MFTYTSDKERLRTHFQKDPVLFSYHLGDLDDFFFSHCQWAAIYSGAEHLPVVDDVILVYSGGRLPTVMAFGVSSRFGWFLEEIRDLLPYEFFCHFQARDRNRFEGVFDEIPLGMHHKMRLDATRVSRRSEESTLDIRRLDDSHHPALVELYSNAYPDNYYDRRMLATGKYFGVFEQGKIVAVAGVHVYSTEYKIAVLGNITTAPVARRRGLAGAVTSHLCAELTAEGNLVCLNVKSDNAAATHCYEKLGFVKVHEYEEARFIMRRN